jgi:hypothetical protein
MSLVQHVSAIEGVDREPDIVDDVASLQLSRVPSRLRRTSISYDPMPVTTLEQKAMKMEPVGAYEVSERKRLGRRAFHGHG